ncbi:SDR family oxidoreductase [Petropleomorpha daqingensis]|uniref:Uncharacterized protein YbjT (DUF2867 family) n=1 Tax=Petropleomorpha daqingensis TaxID=2026353 RepID=A0A853CAU5_9ACTN|nr:NAD(P)H-binding protein [Petropleomorpha daqingensis]NYJ04279.1 uncharacterized protein YbjT (DUF2867 family) [Petropleomorpha daqingensis]
MILVVGATGQLGSLVVRTLREQGHPVRAMVRDLSTADDLAATGATLVRADLTEPETLDAALEGVTAVVATANVAAPTRPGDRSDALDAGYAQLVERAERSGVSRFVLASVPGTPVDDEVPVARSKRRTERLLAASGLSWVSVQMPPFTEVWLALVGSRIPLRGEQRATLTRAYPTLRTFRRIAGGTIEDLGLMLVPGPAAGRQAFLSVHDAARVLAACALDDSISGQVEVGGPEALSWADVAQIYSRLLDRRVRVVAQPAALFTGLQKLLGPVAPSLAGIMALNRLMAVSQSDWNTTAVTDRLGVHDLRTVEQVLQEKAALAPTS